MQSLQACAGRPSLSENRSPHLSLADCLAGSFQSRPRREVTEGHLRETLLRPDHGDNFSDRM